MNELTNRINKADLVAVSAGNHSAFRPAQIRRPSNGQTAPPIPPRRPTGCSNQSVRAALHAAEFAEWQACGGDYLSSDLAGSLVRAYQIRTL